LQLHQTELRDNAFLTDGVLNVGGHLYQDRVDREVMDELRHAYLDELLGELTDADLYWHRSVGRSCVLRRVWNPGLYW